MLRSNKNIEFMKKVNWKDKNRKNTLMFYGVMEILSNVPYIVYKLLTYLHIQALEKLRSNKNIEFMKRFN